MDSHRYRPPFTIPGIALVPAVTTTISRRGLDFSFHPVSDRSRCGSIRGGSCRALRSDGRSRDIVADLIAQDAEIMQVSIEGMKPAALRAGLRRTLKGNEDVKMAQRGEETFLMRGVKE